MCPLVVGGDDDFANDVVTALDSICPGVTLKDRTVETTGVVCGGYCQQPAGCNLIQALVDCTETVQIVPAEDLSAVPDNFYVGSTRTIEWYRDSGTKDFCEDCPPDREDDVHPNEAILAHELIHAWHHCPPNPTYLYDAYAQHEELCAVCGENVIRREMGLVERCRYNEASACSACGTATTAVWESTFGYDCVLPDGSDKRDDCDCAAEKEAGDNEDAPKDSTNDKESESTDGDGCLVAWLCWIVRWVRRIAQMCERRHRTPVRRFRALPKDYLLLSDFDSILPGDSPLEQGIKSAAKLLVLKRRRESSPELERWFHRSDDATMLEIVYLSGGYRVILAAVTPERAVFGSNLTLQLVNRRSVIGGVPGDLRLHVLPPVQALALEQMLQTPTFGASSNGIAGRTDIADGHVIFLRVKAGGEIRRTAFKGGTFSGDMSSDVGRPVEPDEGPKWDAINTVLEFGIRELERLGDPWMLRRRP